MFQEATTHKMFETNSSFHVKQRTTWKVCFQFSVFQEVSATIKTTFILAVILGARLSFNEV